MAILFVLLFNYFHCKDPQKFFTQSLHDDQHLPLYTFMLSYTFMNDDIVDIEKTDGISLLTFVVYDFSRLLLHPAICSIIHLRSA